MQTDIISTDQNVSINLDSNIENLDSNIENTAASQSTSSTEARIINFGYDYKSDNRASIIVQAIHAEHSSRSIIYDMLGVVRTILLNPISFDSSIEKIEELSTFLENIILYYSYTLAELKKASILKDNRPDSTLKADANRLLPEDYSSIYGSASKPETVRREKLEALNELLKKTIDIITLINQKNLTSTVCTSSAKYAQAIQGVNMYTSRLLTMVNDCVFYSKNLIAVAGSAVAGSAVAGSCR